MGKRDLEGKNAKRRVRENLGEKPADGAGLERAAKAGASAAQTRRPVSMPDGSGAVVLYVKMGDSLKSVAVIPVKSVVHEASQTPGWIQVENALMPYQLVFGEPQPVWAELRRFSAYKRNLRQTKRLAKARSPNRENSRGELEGTVRRRIDSSRSGR